jgi:hypothetical protein
MTLMQNLRKKPLAAKVAITIGALNGPNCAQPARTPPFLDSDLGYSATRPGSDRSPEATSQTSVTHNSGACRFALTRRAEVTPS